MRKTDQSYPVRLADMCRSIDNYARLLAESMLYDLRQHMNGRIIEACKSAGFDARGGRIYDACLRLMRSYRRALAEYEGTADLVVSPKLKSILDGIQSVIRARLSTYPAEFSGEQALNPFFLEKKRIIGEGLEGFGHVFEECAEAFTAGELDACLRYARGLFVTLDEHDCPADGENLAGEIARRQEEAMGARLSAALRDAVSGCGERLDGCAPREEALHYRELLESEREILGSVIKIEIPFDRACSPTEEEVANSISAPLAEAYCELERDIAAIHTQGGAKAPEPPGGEENAPLWSGEMLSAVLASTNFEGFARSLKKELDGVCRALEKDAGISAEREISNRLFARAKYEYRKKETEHAIMADEMLKVFEGALSPGGGELPPGDAGAIMEGINETLRIKAESLRESKQGFISEMAERLKRLRKEQPKIDARGLGDLKPEIDPAAKAEFFEKYRQRMQRHIAEHQEFSSKKCREFLKESLLFEVITFGEIMSYSAPRLRGGENGEARAYAAALDRAWGELQSILSKNLITPIAPGPHDPFNGREHEVLTAEQNPDFNKGEIIKLMNPGYARDGAVLVRANVVAAR